MECFSNCKFVNTMKKYSKNILNPKFKTFNKNIYKTSTISKSLIKNKRK